jgi:hypothetical protein
MKFWSNIFRYPRFFVSSIIGLFLVLVSPFLKVLKNNNNNNKTLTFLFFLIVILGIGLILNLMLNSEYY